MRPGMQGLQGAAGACATRLQLGFSEHHPEHLVPSPLCAQAKVDQALQVLARSSPLPEGADHDSEC